MKKNSMRFLFVGILVTLMITNRVGAQNTSPFWSLAGNSNADTLSKLGTTNFVPLNIVTNGSTKVYIDPFGKVGVGTVSPLSLFHVNGFGSFGNQVTTGNATRALNLADDNAVLRVLRVHPTFAPAVELISRTSADGANVAYWDFYTQPSDASFRIRDRQFGGAGLDRVTISHAAGYVGIGTTAPAFSLDARTNFVFGQFKSTGGYAGVILDKSAVNQNGYVIHRTAGTDQWTEGTIGNNNFSLHNWPLGSDALTVNVGNNNVGLGTTAPLFPLDVRNSFVFGQFKASAGYAGVILDKSTAVQNGYVVHRTAGTDQWTEGTIGNNNFSLHNWPLGKDALTVNIGTNYVGLGITTPLFPLDVRNSFVFGQFKSTGGYAGLIVDKSAANQNGYLVHRTAGFDQWTEGTIGNNNFSLRNWPLGTDALTVSISNNFVGLGTTTPAFSLDVRRDFVFGQFKSTGGYAGVILDKSAIAQNEYVIHRTNGSDTWVEGTIGTNNFSIRNWPLGRDALTVNFSNNNVGIGTATPGNRLVATNNTTNGPTALIQNLLGSTSFNDGLYIQAGNNGGTGGSWYAAFQRPDGSVIGSIEQATATSVRYNTTSDKRLKTNIRETKFGLADVKKIQVKDYKYINTKEEQTGFIAQQLFEVFPEAVAVGGEDPKTRPWMVDYGRVTPLLVKAIQDLSAQNESKESTIASLQQQINSLAAELKNLKAMIVNGTNDVPVSIKSGGYLKQNIPNPSNNSTIISYRLPVNTERGQIRITDLQGNSVKIYNASKGDGQLNIRSGELSAGVYNYTLYANNKLVDSKQMVVAR